jgi:hypothetical protein
MLHPVADDFQSVDDPVWAPGVRCPRCSKRHQSWHAVASCRWRRGLAWVSGAPPAGGPCFALVSFCGRNRCPGSYITVTLWATKHEAEQSKGGIDRFACGGACCGQHEIFTMAPA